MRVQRFGRRCHRMLFSDYTILVFVTPFSGLRYQGEKIVLKALIGEIVRWIFLTMLDFVRAAEFLGAKFEAYAAVFIGVMGPHHNGVWFRGKAEDPKSLMDWPVDSNHVMEQ